MMIILRVAKILSCQVLLLVAFVGLACKSADSSAKCRYEIVESMPEKLVFNDSLSFNPKPTHESLIELIEGAKKTLRIASFYVTLTAEPEFADHPSTKPGKDIMEAIISAAKRGVDLEVILDNSSKNYMSNPEDVKKLLNVGKLRHLNMTRLLGAGVLHTKFLIADNQSLYVGSSNFDWRSYSQIKEIGIQFTQCQSLATDLDKVFQTYMLMSEVDTIPDVLPKYLETQINIEHPLELNIGRQEAQIFLASSPPPFNGLREKTGRTDDIEGLIRIINGAKHSISISVMNYSPRTEFIWPKKFWPLIDNALREAASERRVKIRLLFSDWSHVKPEELMWYRSLDDIQSPALHGGGIEVRMLKVPAFDDFQSKIPYARVKHDKYMVTDNGLYIGTSNWSPDYFINTCGVSVNIAPKLDVNQKASKPDIINQMQALFDRDFSSVYSSKLSHSS